MDIPSMEVYLHEQFSGQPYIQRGQVQRMLGVSESFLNTCRKRRLITPYTGLYHQAVYSVNDVMRVALVAALRLVEEKPWDWDQIGEELRVIDWNKREDNRILIEKVFTRAREKQGEGESGPSGRERG